MGSGATDMGPQIRQLDESVPDQQRSHQRQLLRSFLDLGTLQQSSVGANEARKDETDLIIGEFESENLRNEIAALIVCNVDIQ